MTGNFIEQLLEPTEFELLLSKDVFWVPYNTLGKGQLSTKEIIKIMRCTPEEKRKAINTLTDAIRLFIFSNFREYDDTVKVIENGIEWEYYCNGYDAVKKNGGCCSSCCAWMNYMFIDRIQTHGILSIIRTAGGHAINYFYNDGWYYFLDAEVFLKDYIKSICPQTGKRADFRKSRFLTGAMIKAKSLEMFALYYKRYSMNMYRELLFINEGGKNQSVPIGCSLERRHLFIPKDECVSVIELGDKRELISYEYSELFADHCIVMRY